MSERALQLNPVNMPRAWFYHALASFDTGNFEAAEKSALRAIDEDKAHAFPRAEYLLGVLLARKGESTNAAAHLRTFLELAPNDTYAERARQLLAEADKPARGHNSR
jgi:tetratricopeptide (TPR) repeat protein